MVAAFGGKCGACKTVYPIEVYDFHHLNPAEKEFGLTNSLASPKSWLRIVVELRKCVMLCANCHRLVHSEVIALPTDAQRFDESFLIYK